MVVLRALITIMESNDRSVYMSLVKFFLPFLIAALGILSLRFVVPEDSFTKLAVLMFGYFFPPLGKESIIPIGVAGGELVLPFFNIHLVVPPIPQHVMAVSIAFVDIVVALFLVWNYDLAKNIPLVGAFMNKVEKLGKRSSSKYAWVKPLRFIGIVLFVIVPFQGSGGVVGSILGRLIGMRSWHTFLAISIGALVGCSLIAYFADFVLSVLVKNLLLGLLILIVVLVVGLMVYAYRKRLVEVEYDD